MKTALAENPLNLVANKPFSFVATNNERRNGERFTILKRFPFSCHPIQALLFLPQRFNKWRSNLLDWIWFRGFCTFLKCFISLRLERFFNGIIHADGRYSANVFGWLWLFLDRKVNINFHLRGVENMDAFPTKNQTNMYFFTVFPSALRAYVCALALERKHFNIKYSLN